MKKSNLIQRLILLLVIVGMLLIWPVCIVRNEVTQTIEHEIYKTTEGMKTDTLLTQEFIAKESVLSAFDLVIDYNPELSTEGIFKIEIIDSEESVVYEGLFPYFLVEDYTFYRILTYDLHLKKGDIYRYRLTNQDITENLPGIVYTVREQETGEGYRQLCLGDAVIEGESFVRYVWKEPLDIVSVLGVWSCLALGGFFLWELAGQCKMKNGIKNKQEEQLNEMGKIQD